MTVIAFGDSVTFGQGVGSSKAWPHLCGYLNRGIKRDTTRLGLERFPDDVQQSGASKVLIQFGYNDCNRWDTDHGLPRVSIRAFEANLDEMIQRARVFQIEPVLVGMYKTLKPEGYQLIQGAYQKAIRRIATSRKVKLIDPEWLITEEHLLDELHLNEHGHEAFASLISGKVISRV